MKRTLAFLSIACSAVLSACQAMPPPDAGTLCVLQPIPVAPAVRDYLRAPLSDEAPLPDGYERFVRGLAAHNATMAALCPPGMPDT